MYANGAFKNPFADFDFSKFSSEFKLPVVNVETIVETARKNFATMTSVNTSAVESFKTIAQRQGDMVRAAMEDLMRVEGISESVARPVYDHFHDN